MILLNFLCSVLELSHNRVNSFEDLLCRRILNTGEMMLGMLLGSMET